MLCLACDQRYAGALDDPCPACGAAPVRRGCWPVFAPELADENEGFEAESFTHLAELEAGNFWFQARNRLILDLLARHFPAAESFCEIGCGTGFVLTAIRARYPQLRLAASDIHVEALQFAAERLPGVPLFQADARYLPYDQEFDVIGAFDVLEHIEEDEHALRACRAALRPGGGLLLTVPQHRALWSPADDYAHHKRRYSRRELAKKLQSSGLRIQRLTSFVTSLLPLMALSRWQQRRRDDAYDPTAEFRISAWMNAVLARVLDMERGAIRLGVTLPVGGSLVAVAVRD